MHQYVIPAGGILAGSGVVCLLFGFAARTGAPMATTFSQLGTRALDDIQVTSTGWLGIGLLLAGVVLMVAGNASAWRHTGGY